MYDKNKLFAWYVWACDEKTGVSFPNKVHDSKDDRKKLPEAVIRLVTRLMFVWFVRQKGLIPSELFDRAEISKLLKAGFSPNARNDGTYYNAILQNLFFATLNSPESHRDFRPDRRAPNGYNDGYNCKTLYRYKAAFKPEMIAASSIPHAVPAHSRWGCCTA